MSERLEREIEEILRRMDSSSSRVSFSLRLKRTFLRWGADIRYFVSGLGLQVTPTKVMVLSLVLFGLTVFLRASLRQLSLYIGLLAALLFFAAIVMSARQGGGIRYERRWRGQLVDMPGNSPWRALEEWWLRQQRKLRRWFNGR